MRKNEAQISVTKTAACAVMILWGAVSAFLALPFFSDGDFIHIFSCDHEPFFYDYVISFDGVALISAGILCAASGALALFRHKKNNGNLSACFATDILSVILYAVTLILYLAALALPHGDNAVFGTRAILSACGIISVLLHLFLYRSSFGDKNITSTMAVGIFSPVILLMLICTAGNFISSQQEESATVQVEIPEGGGEFSNMNTLDFDGNQFTFMNLKGYKVNVINIWATFCGPCIREMPDLDAISKEYDDVQVIGICWDTVSLNGERDQKLYDLALKIVNEDIGVSYTMLQPSAGLMNGVLYDVFSFPTTFITDENGNILESFSGTRSKEQFIEIIGKYR